MSSARWAVAPLPWPRGPLRVTWWKYATLKLPPPEKRRSQCSPIPLEVDDFFRGCLRRPGSGQVLAGWVSGGLFLAVIFNFSSKTTSRKSSVNSTCWKTTYGPGAAGFGHLFLKSCALRGRWSIACRISWCGSCARRRCGRWGLLPNWDATSQMHLHGSVYPINWNRTQLRKLCTIKCTFPSVVGIIYIYVL